METRKWIRLDNASNIFVAARNDTDTKVFRLTAEMSEEVDSALLQKALNHTYEEYPLFHNVLRRGIFWYYLEETDRMPKVRLETEPPCSPIYHYDKREFLFRVLYRDHQIHLEVFHALTDGTGALWFFEDLLTEYVRLRYAISDDEMSQVEKREKQDLEDSFKRYFRKKSKNRAIYGRADSFENVFDKEKMEAEGTESDKLLKYVPNPLKNLAYQVKGKRTPDHRIRIINVKLSVRRVLDLARKEDVSLTVYLTALYMWSVYQAKEHKAEDTKISVSIPINLRQFFPSVSVRNFFSTTIVSYIFKKGEPAELKDIYKEIDRQFQKQLKKEEIENRLARFVRFEYNPVIRIIPRPIKDVALKFINYLNNQMITLAMSNLGIVNLPDEMKDYVEDIYFYTSVIRPQFCMMSYEDHLTISFTSPFIETDIYKHFVRYLSKIGIEAEVDVNRVTREELQEE